MVAGWEHAITCVTSLFHDAHNSYHRLNPAIRGTLSPLKLLLEYLPLIFILERLSGGKTTQYKSAGFRQDLFYWVWHSSGLYRALFTGSLLGVLAPYLKVFDLKLLMSLNTMVRGIVYYLIAEFIGYWYHRWQHSNRFLWAFHTTHHTQEHLSFATFNRFHPIDEFLMDVIPYLPLLMLGAGAQQWVPLFWLHRVLVYLQHSEVRCRFGPLEKIFVSPHFHSLHHSPDPAQYNHNFAPTLSLLDYCFGTAVDGPRPTRYGLPDVEMTTLASTFLVPFRLVYETYFKRTGRVEPARAD
jgi:sterol desaturase/sphingolipid hydroxylase (fatty acid hydroxylase superfamily)